MVDWDELKRLQGDSKASYRRRGVRWTMMPVTQEMAAFYYGLVEAFPQILAERSAAQKLRDALFELLDDGVQPRVSTVKSAEEALANFDNPEAKE